MEAATAAAPTEGAQPAAGEAGAEGQEAAKGNGAAVENDGAPKTGEQPEAGAAAPEKPSVPTKKAYKFKIDDQEVTEELTEEDLVKAYQKAKGADKRFQEAATMKQQTERLYQLLKESPFDVIEKIHGDKARQMMEERLWAKIQREQMEPKDRENLEMREQLQRLEEEKKQAAVKAQQEEFNRMKTQYAQQIDKDISDAIKAAGKTVTPYFFKRVAHYMLSAMNQGKQVDPKDVIPLVDQDLQADLRAMFEATNEDGILQLLGDPVLEKVRRADLKRVRGGYVPPAPPPKPGEEKKDKKLNPRELEKRTSLFEWD